MTKSREMLRFTIDTMSHSCVWSQFSSVKYEASLLFRLHVHEEEISLEGLLSDGTRNTSPALVNKTMVTFG